MADIFNMMSIPQTQIDGRNYDQVLITAKVAEGKTSHVAISSETGEVTFGPKANTEETVQTENSSKNGATRTLNQIISVEGIPMADVEVRLNNDRVASLRFAETGVATRVNYFNTNNEAFSGNGDSFYTSTTRDYITGNVIMVSGIDMKNQGSAGIMESRYLATYHPLTGRALSKGNNLPRRPGAEGSLVPHPPVANPVTFGETLEQKREEYKTANFINTVIRTKRVSNPNVIKDNMTLTPPVQAATATAQASPTAQPHAEPARPQSRRPDQNRRGNNQEAKQDATQGLPRTGTDNRFVPG